MTSITFLFRHLLFMAGLLLLAAPYQAKAQDGCDAFAGIMSVDVGPICLHNGQATLTGVPSNDAVLPPGYVSTYILTRTNGLIIEQMGPSPNFLVNSVDVWRIHRLVFNPATLDLGTVQFGITSAYDVQSLITQGGGPICASLSMTNAAVKTMECEAPCAAFASGMTIDSTTVCLTDGQATLTAMAYGTSNVPAGFQVQYLLTRTNGLIIEQLSSTPTFTVNSVDVWRIHNLVYNPATLDLGTIDLGVTSAYDLQSMLLQGGGTICASLDISGAPVKTGECNPSCIAEAGLTSPDHPDLCLNKGVATLNATPDGSSIVPTGFTTAYLLTQGTDTMVILATASTPEFTVQAAGEYGIHSFVYDPSTFEISTLELGLSTIMDLNAQLLQGGGSICASLELAGANFQVVDCTPSCIADAGSMSSETNAPCLMNGSAVLSAQSNGDTLVPPGFMMGYFLSQGPGLLLMDLASSPAFTVTDSGLYHIHAFVYDPSTFDVSMLQFGVITAYEANAMLLQGGGSICAGFDLLGAAFTVNNCAPPCTAGTDTVITVCLQDPAFTLFSFLGGDPCPGGTWSTPNGIMFSGIFNPAVDPAGVYIYTVDDPFGGIHLAMVVVNVLECPERSFTVPVKGNEAQGTASVDDPYSGRRLGVWPNPAHGGLHVSVPFPISGIAHVELIDATGRSFQTTPVLQNKDVLTLDISTLAPGPWTIRISEADRVLTGRFICGLR